MYYVYLLKSLSLSWYYVGLSSNPNKRLKEHNNDYVKSTKSRRPYSLIYKKEFNSIKNARDYEKFVKIRSNKEKIIRSL